MLLNFWGLSKKMRWLFMEHVWGDYRLLLVYVLRICRRKKTWHRLFDSFNENHNIYAYGWMYIYFVMCGKFGKYDDKLVCFLNKNKKKNYDYMVLHTHTHNRECNDKVFQGIPVGWYRWTNFNTVVSNLKKALYFIQSL